VEVEQGDFVLARTGDRLHPVEAHERGSRLALQRIAQSPGERRERQVDRVQARSARHRAGAEQQVRLAAARWAAEVHPVSAATERHRAEQFDEFGVAVEGPQLVIRLESQRQRDLRAHGSG
jgi:hypothetical protein